MKAKVNKVTIEIKQTAVYGDTAEAWVTVTTPDLSLDPALRALTGDRITQETEAIAYCDVGEAVITGGGRLFDKHIIHAVGPKWGEGSERGKLANATWTALSLAEEKGLKAIALPAISTGTLGYPVENCAKTMLEQIIDFTFEPLKHLRLITLCMSTEAESTAFGREFQRQLETLKDNDEGKVRV